MRDGRPCCAILLATLTLAACSRPPRERLVLAGVHLPALGLVSIAQSKGYFEEAGLEVEERRFATGRDAVAALAAGEADVATSFETPIVLRARREPGLVILTTLHTSTRDVRVVARRDRGIRVPSDLAGRRVAAPRGTHAEYFLHALLEYSGVRPQDVHLEDIHPEAAPGALAEGRVDAIAVWTPHAERAVRLLEARGAVELETDVYAEISVLSTRADVHTRRRGALVKLVRALSRAERLVQEHPADAFDALRDGFPGVSDAELREAWSRVRPTLGLTHELATFLQDQSDYFRSVGRADAAPLDPSHLFAPGILTEVDREAVTFVTPARSPLGR